MSANGWRFFYQIYFMSGIADVQGSLHAYNTTAHNHDIRMYIYLSGIEAFMVIDPVNRCSYKCFCFSSSLIFILGHPGNLFANRSHLEKIWVEPGPLTSTLKGLLMKSWRTGGHHNPVKVKFLNVLFDHLLAGIWTHEFIISSDHYIFQFPGKSSYFFYTDFSSDINAAMADIKTQPNGHAYPLIWLKP